MATRRSAIRVEEPQVEEPTPSAVEQAINESYVPQMEPTVDEVQRLREITMNSIPVLTELERSAMIIQNAEALAAGNQQPMLEGLAPDREEVDDMIAKGRSLMGESMFRLVSASPDNITVRSMLASKLRVMTPPEVVGLNNLLEHIGRNFKPASAAIAITAHVNLTQNLSGRCSFRRTESCRYTHKITLNDIKEALRESPDDVMELVNQLVYLIRDRAIEGGANWVTDDQQLTDEEVVDSELDDYALENHSGILNIVTQALKDHFPDEAEELLR